MGKRLYVTGSINELAKYLNMDEFKILSIFDYDQRKPISQIEKEMKKNGSTKTKGEKYGTTNKGKTLQASTDSV